MAVDVLLPVRELHLFAGAGGGILGGLLLGHACVCAVEIEPYCRKVLLQRQGDGVLPRFPIWDDIRTFDGKPWRGLVDVVCGGFPCQDISVGGKGAGIGGTRNGLWKEMARVVREVEPQYVFVENSPMLVNHGLEVVLGDLASLGFDARWCVLGADDFVAANHHRKRIWIFGFDPDSSYAGRGGGSVCTDSVFAERPPAKDQQTGYRREPELGSVDVAQRFSSYRGALRALHAMAHRVDRLAALGNGQVPAVVKLAWQTLTCATRPECGAGGIVERRQ